MERVLERQHWKGDFITLVQDPEDTYWPPLSHCDDCKLLEEENFLPGAQEWIVCFNSVQQQVFLNYHICQGKLFQTFYRDRKNVLLTITFQGKYFGKNCQEKVENVISDYRRPFFGNRPRTTASFLRVVVFAQCMYLWELV